MAMANLHALIDLLDVPLREALRQAVHETLPGGSVDEHKLHEALTKALLGSIPCWAHVPEMTVKADLSDSAPAISGEFVGP